MPSTIGFVAVVRRSTTLLARMFTRLVPEPVVEIPVIVVADDAVPLVIRFPLIVAPATLLPTAIPVEVKFEIELFASTTFEFVNDVVGILIPFCAVVIALFIITVFDVLLRVG